MKWIPKAQDCQGAGQARLHGSIKDIVNIGLGDAIRADPVGRWNSNQETSVGDGAS